VARKWSDLRPPAPVRKAEVEEPIETVIARLAGTHDGRRLFEFLMEEGLRPTPVGAPDSLVREADGARRLVDRLRDMATVKP